MLNMNTAHAHFNISAGEIGVIFDSVSVCPPSWILTVEWSGDTLVIGFPEGGGPRADVGE